ncbi:MAG: hypothetical protein RLZZ414_2025 [Bacteroidota bacterium]|jgi:hypothetical protein
MKFNINVIGGYIWKFLPVITAFIFASLSLNHYVKYRFYELKYQQLNKKFDNFGQWTYKLQKTNDSLNAELKKCKN